MALSEAWTTLGWDFKSVMLHLKSIDNISDRVSAAEDFRNKAKIIAKKLMAKHHPDKGGDGSEFIKISQALESIDHHTEQLKSEFKEMISRPKKERDIFIQIDQP